MRLMGALPCQGEDGKYYFNDQLMTSHNRDPQPREITREEYENFLQRREEERRLEEEWRALRGDVPVERLMSLSMTLEQAKEFMEWWKDRRRKTLCYKSG